MNIGKLILKEEDILKCISKANKTWLTKYINKQKEYGDTDTVRCAVEKLNEDEFQVEIDIGESWGYFFKRKWGEKKGTYERDYGDLRHEEQVTKIVNELIKKVSW